MITKQGKNYFVSTWSECDCHLDTHAFNALTRLTGEYTTRAIGVADRDYDSGMVKVLVVYEDDVSDDEIAGMKITLGRFIEEEYADSVNKVIFKSPDIKIIRYKDLEKYGYSDDNIEYCFMWHNIFRKEL